jgi:hypothetical protein
MFFYQIQERVLMLSDQEPLEFPGDAVVELELGPPKAFGTSAEPSRLALLGHQARLIWNANTGHTTILSDPPLGILDVTLETPSQSLVLNGDCLTFTWNCMNLSDLTETLQAFYYIFPTLLNIGFHDPPFVRRIGGRVGDVEFNWQHSEAVSQFRTTTQEALEDHVAKSFNRFDLLSAISNRRLVAALYYFHQGSRLSVVGKSRWEFMGEAILNFAKTLEILFTPERDTIRAYLSKLGYSEEEVEGDFIPIIILRNKFDVAHPRMAIFNQTQLQTLYSYLSRTEDVFRELLARIIENLEAGTFSLDEVQNLRLDRRDQKDLDYLLEKVALRVNSIDSENDA